VGPGLLVPIGLVGLFTPRRGEAPRPYAAWAAFAPAYVVSVAVFFVSSRYRLPLWVALCVSGGAALARLAELAGTRRWRELAWLAAAIAVLAFVANRDLGLDEGRSNQRTEMIVHLIDAGRRQEAQALLEKTEAEHPRRALLYYRVGRAFQDRREWAPALDSMGKALALEPAQPDVHYSVGLVLLQSGRASEAVAHLEAAEGAEGVAPAERDYQLACALAEAGRLDQAREALERVVAAGARGVAESWLEVGGLALRLQAPTLAEAAFRKAVEAAPAAAAAYEGLGLALGYQERLDEAERHLAEACRLDASGASARLNLAVLLARRGRLEDARARAQEALRLRPDYQQARALLGQLEALAGPRR
jgi:tetratricopeptide (TPR) repeat protein